MHALGARSGVPFNHPARVPVMRARLAPALFIACARVKQILFV
jgi:hypothetical protein